jgi:hypothetical protein
MHLSVTCKICSGSEMTDPFVLNDQVVSHRYLSGSEEAEERIDMFFSQCKYCATVQMQNKLDIPSLVPKYSWINCTEPEGHLDDFSETLVRVCKLTKDSRILGLSFKEDTLIDRLNKKGFSNTYRFENNANYDLSEPYASVESITHALNEGKSKDILKERGVSDLVMGRHILEHAQDFPEFVSAVKRLIHDSGFVFFEIPDCTEGFLQKDYSILWEEHAIYFTESTFKNFFSYHGMELVYFEKVKYHYENVFLAVAKKSMSTKDAAKSFCKDEIQRYSNFSESFEASRGTVVEWLRAVKGVFPQVAIYGAGHMSNCFINYLKIADHIDFIIDDSEHLEGMYMPGSKLPIYASSQIKDLDNVIILSSLSEHSERIVKQKLKATGIDVRMLPIFRSQFLMYKISDESHAY